MRDVRGRVMPDCRISIILAAAKFIKSSMAPILPL